MRLLYTLIFIFITLTSYAQTWNTSIVAPRVVESIQQAPNDYHPVYFLLSDQVDVVALNLQFGERGLNQKERLNILVNILTQKAKVSQVDLMATLRQSPDVLANSIESYWISNVIFAEVKANLLHTLSERGDVAAIGFNGKLELEAVEEAALCSAVEPNATEDGLEAINAPALWALGYTGYGQIAYSADTGVDAAHPAISSKYRGTFTSDSEAWFQYSGSETTPNACTDHGTHTLGTMVGLDRNTNDTIGVAFNAQWIGSANLCNNSGTASNIGAMQWALNPDDNLATIADMPTVINNSWYDPSIGNPCENIYVSTLTTLEAAGIAVVFSAGNAGPNVSTITTPKNINIDLVNSFAVGSVDASTSAYIIANSSSRGPSTCGNTGSLLIKPEVTAPGVGVRSCIYDGNYGTKNGTSMAAPHVAGAILLLKEAFPELLGTDLKLALYFSATDLGAAGEDNIYGMGMINVLSAYNYLIDQGHVPVDPQVDYDLMALNVIEDQVSCGNTARVRFWVENAGEATVDNFEVNYRLNQGQDGTGTFPITETLVPGERKLILLPEISLSTGLFEVELEVKNPNGTTDERVLNDKTIGTIRVSNDVAVEAYLDTQSNSICQNQQALLRAEPIDGAEIQWYDEAGNLVGVGENFVSEDLSETTTFFASANYKPSLGLADLEAATGTAVGSNPTGGLIFDCQHPTILKSVKIFPSGLGPMLIGLRSQQGEVIWNHQVVITSLNPQVVILNKAIPVENNMRLQLISGPVPSYSFGALDYPYEIPGILRIKSTNAGNPNEYLYFYDWQLEYEHVCERIPVTVEVLNNTTNSEANFEIMEDSVTVGPASEVFFTNTSQNTNQWYWDFGDGTISTTENPVHIYNEVGRYVVSLTASQDGECADAMIDTVWVTEMLVSTQTPRWTQEFALYPNPTQHHFYLDFAFSEATEITIELVDVLGRTINYIPARKYQKERLQMDTNELEAGIYFLNLKTKQHRSTQRVLKF
ncbi:MAG: S8 family serine peptidase [Saprospiraceae bacterium]